MTRRVVVTAAALPVIVAGTLFIGLVFLAWTVERKITRAEDWDV